MAELKIHVLVSNQSSYYYVIIFTWCSIYKSRLERNYLNCKYVFHISYISYFMFYVSCLLSLLSFSFFKKKKRVQTPKTSKRHEQCFFILFFIFGRALLKNDLINKINEIQRLFSDDNLYNKTNMHLIKPEFHSDFKQQQPT